MNKNIRKLGYFFILIFAAQLAFLGYINFYLGPVLATEPHNRRLAAAEAGIHRGAIYDRNGVALARDVTESGKKIRSYPLGESASQLIGFVSEQYGRTGLESQFDAYLLALDDTGSMDKLINRIFNRPSYGYNVYLTLDADLQKRRRLF
jgi:Cell division protein FtsI/penicillin-binding protein 2